MVKEKQTSGGGRRTKKFPARFAVILKYLKAKKLTEFPGNDSDVINAVRKADLLEASNQPFRWTLIWAVENGLLTVADGEGRRTKTYKITPAARNAMRSANIQTYMEEKFADTQTPFGLNRKYAEERKAGKKPAKKKAAKKTARKTANKGRSARASGGKTAKKTGGGGAARTARKVRRTRKPKAARPPVPATEGGRDQSIFDD